MALVLKVSNLDEFNETKSGVQTQFGLTCVGDFPRSDCDRDGGPVLVVIKLRDESALRTAEERFLESVTASARQYVIDVNNILRRSSPEQK